MTRVLWVTVGCAVVLSAFTLAQDGPESAVRGTKRFEKTVIAAGLAHPWEVTWGPDRMLWVTERTGKRVTRIDPTTGARHVAVTIDEASAPGGQDGVLGLALHPELLRGTGNDHVYVSYTYVDRNRSPDPRVTDPESPFRYLRGKIVRFRYDAETGTLGDPIDIITGLPASNDHNSMRLKIGLDRKLYLSIGDMGNGQFGHFCQPIQSQRLPTREEIVRRDYSAYQGKTLRIDPDGSIPANNPELSGVVSHVFTYGHRNPQGLAFGPDGTLYAAEHGPKTDDEVNVLTSGGNYGWPHVAGMRDDKAYEHARWWDDPTCATLTFSDLEIPSSVPRYAESAYREPIVEPIATLFTVPTGFNFENPACQGVHFMCWPTVGISSVEFYDGRGGAGIPGWDAALIVTTLKRGSLYVLPLDASLKKVAGPIARYLHTQNRYRDIAIHPDGRTIYVATDPAGLVESRDGGATEAIEDGGAILAFTYVGEGDGRTTSAPTAETPRIPSRQAGPEFTPADPGVPPTFTSAQVSAGRAAYDSYCAVCHGNTLTNGTFGTPLAGEYFRTRWSGRSVAALYDKSRDTMPPAAPASLPRESYAAILAYIFQVNGLASGDVPLPVDADRLREMRIP